MKQSTWTKIINVVLVLAMVAVWVPAGVTMAEWNPPNKDGLIPFMTMQPPQGIVPADDNLPNDDTADVSLFDDDLADGDLPILPPSGGGSSGAPSVVTDIDYFAVAGNYAVLIDLYLPAEEPYQGQQWIEVILQPVGGGEPFPRDFYTDMPDEDYIGMPRGALILGDTPAGVYEIICDGSGMGTLKVLAPEASEVLTIGGSFSEYGRPDLYNRHISWSLYSLFNHGYIAGSGSWNHDAYYCQGFLDGKVYLSLIAINIKPSDITKLQCDGRPVSFSVIPGTDYGNGIRQYHIKLDASTIAGIQPEDEMPAYVRFTATVKGADFDATLVRAGNSDYYLDIADLGKLELGIEHYGMSVPPQTLTARIYNTFFWEENAVLLAEQELTLKNGRYTMKLPNNAYLFERSNSVFICLYTDAEEQRIEYATFLYSSDVMSLYFQVSDEGYQGYASGVNPILANLNGQGLFAYPNYLFNPAYQSNPNLSLRDAAFNPVNGVSIARDNSDPNDWDALDECRYKFIATRPLTVDGTYYLCLGAFPLVKLKAVSRYSDFGGGDGGGETYNEIDGGWRYAAGQNFWFAVNMPLGVINPDDWSIKLTNILPGASQDPVTYSCAVGSLLVNNNSSNHWAGFMTSTPLDAGIYQVQYYRGANEIEAKYDDAGANDFYYVGPRVILVLDEQQRQGFQIIGVGKVLYTDTGDRGIYVEGVLDTDGSVPTLKADFYAMKPKSIDADARKTVTLTKLNTDGDYFYYEVFISSLKAAGLIPGFHYVVISDNQGVVRYTSYILLTATFLGLLNDTGPTGPGSSGSSGGSGNDSEEPQPTDTTPPPDGWANPYSDVTNINWFYEAVEFVTRNKLMNGTGDTIFSPNVTMTRAMLVTVLYRLEGEPSVTSYISFSDVKGNMWYTNAISWAAGNDIVGGYGNGIFGLDDPVTREQAVTILYRYAKVKGLDVSASADLSGYSDVGDISDWALDAIKWAVATGIIQGRTETTAVPQGTSTRAEVATIFKRYIEGVLGSVGGSAE